MQSGLIRNLILALVVYCMGTGLASAQDIADTSQPVIRQILFVGNEFLSTQQIQEILHLRAGENYDVTRLEREVDALLDAYRKQGYAFATITPQIMQLTANQVQVILVIAENAQAVLGTFQIIGAETLSPGQLRKELGWKSGQVLSGKLFETGIQRVLAWYSELGHPHAEVRVEDVHYVPGTGEVHFTLSVSEGPETRIAGVEVKGLQKTRPGVVRREIPLQIGELYDQRRIDRSVRRLERLGYFYSIDRVVLAPGQTDNEILFQPQVTEARTGRFNGVLGYAPAETGEGAQLTGTLEAREINLLGTGRRIGISWKSGILSSYEVSYEEPWLFGRRVHLGFAISGLQQEDRLTQLTSEEKGGSIRLRVGLTEVLEADTRLAYERVRLPDETQDRAKYSTELGGTWDSRDSILNPTQGHLERIEVEYASGDLVLQRLSVGTQHFQTAWPKQVISLGVYAARVWGDTLPPTELLYLGGANTLRGYNEDWFRGPARVYTNLEYRFLVGRSSQFFLFLDTGTVSDIDSPGKLGRLHLGYGFGMRLESKAGAVSVHYGIPQDAGVLDGKIHVSIAPLF